MTFGEWVRNVAIAVDQVVNAVFAGMPDETISARAWRMRNESKFWRVVKELIDSLFFWQLHHCEFAYYLEKERYHLPRSYYEA